MDDFRIIYRILKHLRDAMDFEEFDGEGTQHAYYSDKGFIAVKADGTTSSVGWHDEGAKIVLEVAKKYGFYRK